MAGGKTALTLALALYGRHRTVSAAGAVAAVVHAASELGIDLDSPSLTAGSLASVLDAAEPLLFAGLDLEAAGDPDDLPFGEPDDGPTEAWCGQLITGGQEAVDQHRAGCAECQAAIADQAKAGPVGYSADVAELGYTGDG